MNQPQLTNVTPGAPGRPGAPARRTFSTPLVAAIVLVLLLLVYRLLHHANHYEHLANDVTKALVNNDMRPVEPEFNALRRPELENRAKVGALSNFVNAEGAFKGVKEDTPSGSPDGFHHFIAHFAKGDLSENLTVDADGKIAKFDVHEPQAPQ
jgi:hypothetical protein